MAAGLVLTGVAFAALILALGSDALAIRVPALLVCGSLFIAGRNLIGEMGQDLLTGRAGSGREGWIARVTAAGAVIGGLVAFAEAIRLLT